MATKCKRMNIAVWVVLATAVTTLITTSCRPKPAPVLVETVTPPPVPIVGLTPDATVVAALTAVPQDGPTTEPSPQPTVAEEKCTLPDGWIVFQIRPGDTLYSLAAGTGTAVDVLKSVNCLLRDDIVAGENIFLPQLPPALPAAVVVPVEPVVTEEPSPEPTQEPTEEPPDECASPFSCPNPDIVDTLTIDPGAGNDPDFVPCQNVTQPRLELDSNIKIIELGQRRYFYVCGSGPASATVMNEGGAAEPVNLLTTMPNPDLQPGDASAFIDWPVLPTEPTGVHTMTVAFASGLPVSFRFRVDPPTEERILVVPPTAPPGDSFTVYYVNFDLNSTPDFAFFGEDAPEVAEEHTLTPRQGWSVPITQPLIGISGRGWAQAALNSAPTDPKAAYSIAYDNKRIFTMFWLR